MQSPISNQHRKKMARPGASWVIMMLFVIDSDTVLFHFLMSFLRQHRNALAGIAALGLIFLAYLLTMPPDILPGDSGEFQALIPAGGVLHPSGYPLYQLLGQIEIVLLPLGSIAWRVTLLSALFATAAAGVAMLLFRECGLDTPLAVLGGGVLGLMPMLWRQAIIAEVYTLAVLLLLLVWLAGCRLYHGKSGLLLLALLSGLAMSHHLILAAAVPWPFLALWRRREELRPKRILAAVLLFLTPFSLYGLTFLHARKWMAAFPGETFGYPDAVVRGYISPFWLAGFFKYVTGGNYTAAGSSLWQLSSIDLPGMLTHISGWIGTNFTLLGGLLALLGVIWLARRQRFFLLMTLPAFLIIALFSAHYLMIYQEDTGFLFIALVAFALWITFGVQAIWQRLSGWKRLLPAGLLVAMLALEIVAFRQQPIYWTEMQANGPTPREWATAALTTAEPDSIIFGDWGVITPLRYMQFAEGLREDVMVVHAPLGDDAFMSELLDEAATIGKKAYLLQPKPDEGPVLIPAEP